MLGLRGLCRRDWEVCKEIVKEDLLEQMGFMEQRREAFGTRVDGC